jgi:hypothetical protein
MINTDTNGRMGLSEPNQAPVGLANLPPLKSMRWVMGRKAEVVAAVRTGTVSLDDVCKCYEISMDEFLTWKSKMERFGPEGLRIKDLQHSRAIMQPPTRY